MRMMNQAQGTGDVVRIEECAPISKLKSWRVIETVKKFNDIGLEAAV